MRRLSRWISSEIIAPVMLFEVSGFGVGGAAGMYLGHAFKNMCRIASSKPD